MQGKTFRDYIRKVQEQGITYRECLTAIGILPAEHTPAE